MLDMTKRVETDRPRLNEGEHRSRPVFWASAFAAFLVAHGTVLVLVGRVEPPFLCDLAKVVLTPLGMCLRASAEDVPWEYWAGAAGAAAVLLTWPLLLARSFPVAVIGAAAFWVIYVGGVFHTSCLLFFWGVSWSVDLQMASWLAALLLWGLRGLLPAESWRAGAVLGGAAYTGLIALVGLAHTGPGAILFSHSRDLWVSGGGVACAAMLAGWGICRCVTGVAERMRSRRKAGG